MDIMFTMTMLFFGLLAIFGRGGSASRWNLAVTARLFRRPSCREVAAACPGCWVADRPSQPHDPLTNLAIS